MNYDFGMSMYGSYLYLDLKTEAIEFGSGNAEGGKERRWENEKVRR